MIKKICTWLRTPSKLAIGTLILIIGVGTLIASAGFNKGMEMTNTEQFCSDCHMNDVCLLYTSPSPRD